MPLVRLEARNEFALGAPELYREASREDPREILEGVAVAGLVGILRQLGALAEFAAEVFHGLQEEVMITSSRSQKLTAHVQRLEAALPPLEKAFLAQRSHLHFAYTAGTNWHAHIRLEQNQHVGSDVPQFIMDSYEVCCDPPSFHLLDRFDPGGSGSCLKRYSDPTFFRRSSEASGQTSAEKISNDQKMKKRRLYPRREVSRGTSFSYDSGRTQFTELNVGGNPSPSQTTSTDDVQLRSDLGEQRNLDLRNESSRVEDDSNPSCSMQPEELDSKESISSSLMRNDSDYLDYNFLEHNVSGLRDDDIQIIPSNNEQAGLTSSSFTCDEKTGTNDSIVQGNGTSDLIHEEDHNKDLDLLSSNVSWETPTVDEVDLETVLIMNSKPGSEIVGIMETGVILLDGNRSETDRFMDVLSTVEVESETGRDCTKKNEEGADDDEPDDLTNHKLDHRFSESESNVLVDESFTNDSYQLDPVSAAYRNEVNATNDLDSVSRVENDFHSDSKTEELDFLKNANSDATTCMESKLRDDDDSGMTPNDGARSSSETLKSAPETSNVTPVMFWTNGGLLGLQPSKPPDFSLVVSRSQDPSPEKNEKNSSGKNLPAHQKNGHSIVASKTVSVGHQESNLGDSRVLELSNRLLARGSTVKLLDGASEKPRSPNYQIARTFEQKNHQNVAYRTFSGRANACFTLSPSASPPLQHMKISFQPMNGFETSKLKLKFADGNCDNEGSKDFLPLFQLVPEVSSIGQNDVSDSDDDTFYRSPSSLIDGDCIGYQSEPNSEQWESVVSPSEKDLDLYDAFHRISLSRSVLTISGNGRTIQEDIPVNSGVQLPLDENRLQTSKACHSSDSQIFDSDSLSIRKEMSQVVNSQDLSQPQVTPTPAMDLKHFKDVKEPACQMMHKDLKYDDCLEHSSTAVSQQSKPAPLNRDKLIETKNLGLQKSNGNRESNPRKGIDENDLVGQIRTRSFNLKPTVPTKPTVLSGVQQRQCPGHSDS